MTILDKVEAAIASRDRFVVADLVRATGLPATQVMYALHRLTCAGVISVVGEMAREGSSFGRGARIYAKSTSSAPTVAVQKSTSSALAGAVRTAVAGMQDRFDFSVTDVVEAIGCASYLCTAVMRVLVVLERDGTVEVIVEERLDRGPGRPARRWTTNPETAAMQRMLREVVAKAEADMLKAEADELPDAL